MIDYGNTATIPSSSELLSSYYEDIHVSTIPTAQLLPMTSVTSAVSTQTDASNLLMSTSGTAVMPAINSVLPTSIATIAPSDDSNSRHLSSHTNIGIGIGVTLAVVVILTAAVVLYRRNTKGVKEEEQGTVAAIFSEKRENTETLHELHGLSRQELDNVGCHELQSDKHTSHQPTSGSLG